MNHNFVKIDMSQSHQFENYSGYLLEKELKDIYETQYNDIFPKILIKTQSEFISLLKEKVLLHLKIINKTSVNSLNSKYLEIYTNIYIRDKSKVSKGLEDINKNKNLQEQYLEPLNCYIHCFKCSSIFHKCKNKVIIYKNNIYCLNCQKVYNENQIKLYCNECKTCYLSKLRNVLNKRYEYFYPVIFKKYHCQIEDDEKIKCLECHNDLYYNISYDKINKINEIFCLKCKLLFDLNEILFKCKICQKDFKAEAQLYSHFSNLKTQFFIITHTLIKKNYASPELKYNRKCNCDITQYEKYLHETDKGTLFLGKNLQNEYIIICDTCYSIFRYNDFIWNCPICGIQFKSKKNYYKKSIKKRKRDILFKSPFHNDDINKKRKIILPTSADIHTRPSNIINNIFITTNNDNFFSNQKLKNKSNIKAQKRNQNKDHSFYRSNDKILSFAKLKNININISNYNTDNKNLFSSNKKIKKNFTKTYTLSNILGKNKVDIKEPFENNLCNESTSNTTIKNDNIKKINRILVYDEDNENTQQKEMKLDIPQIKKGIENNIIKRVASNNNFMRSKNISFLIGSNRKDSILSMTSKRSIMLDEGKNVLKEDLNKRNINSRHKGVDYLLTERNIRNNTKSQIKERKPKNYNNIVEKKLSSSKIAITRRGEKNPDIFNRIKKCYEDYEKEKEEMSVKDNKIWPKKEIEFKKDFKSENYSIIKLLGKGTYGKTYLVEEIGTKTRFALKKILINDQTELKENEDEYNLILNLTKEYENINIINIYGIEIKYLDKYNIVMYVLMEDAISDWEKELLNRSQNKQYYDEKELIKILKDLAKTFEILQRKGISHRDVKPQNILHFKSGEYKISDFGEAKNIKKNFFDKQSYIYEDNTMKQTLRGTELYMSPILFEALRSNPYKIIKYNSFKSDVFSLGMCFFLASCLSYEGLYEIREITKNQDKTKLVANRYLSMRYSQKYINILISMLQINEKVRPDFIELKKIVENL